MTLWASLRNLFHSSNSRLMKRGNVTLRWPRSTLPLDVLYTPRSDSYRELLTVSIRELNADLGIKVFLLPSQAIGDMVSRFQLEGLRRLIRSTIMVDVASLSNPKHGSTDIYYDTRNGDIFNCFLELPVTAEPGYAPAMVKHELCHSIGLDHNNEPWSLMLSSLPTPNVRLIPSDISLLKATYG